MSILLQKQLAFAKAVAKFMNTALYDYPELFPECEGLGFTFGDAWAHDGHMPGSLHYQRLAIDLNIFINDKYIATYEDAPLVWDRLGALWLSLNPLARWGGDFQKRDLNHLSFEHDGKA